jgi:hypothetical protein
MNLFDCSFIAVEQLRRDDHLTALITSKQVYFLLGGVPDSSNIILRVPHRELFHCLVMEISTYQAYLVYSVTVKQTGDFDWSFCYYFR